MFQTCRAGQEEAPLVIDGRGRLDQVEFRPVDQRHQFTTTQRLAIEAACDHLREEGAVVEPGPLYRVLRFEAGERLVIEVGLTDYAEHVGIKAHPEWGVRSGALAVCGITQSPDGFLIEKRSPKVAAKPGFYHPLPSGTVIPPSDLAGALFQEAEEELALAPEEMTDLWCLGVLEVVSDSVYQVIVWSRTELTLEQLKGRGRSGAWEQSELLTVPAERGVLERWLTQEKVTTGARTALRRVARELWG